MTQKHLGIWLKTMIVGAAACGFIICAWILPMMGRSIAAHYKGEFDYAYWPCLVFLWACALPCFAALALGWRIAANIGRDRSFCIENAKLLKAISILAACDSAFFFFGNFALACMRMNHISFVLYSFIVVFIGVAISVGAAVVSHLVRKAADLQTESELTI